MTRKERRLAGAEAAILWALDAPHLHDADHDHERAAALRRWRGGQDEVGEDDDGGPKRKVVSR